VSFKAVFLGTFQNVGRALADKELSKLSGIFKYVPQAPLPYLHGMYIQRFIVGIKIADCRKVDKFAVVSVFLT
jgi:hypothetical protein